MAMNPLAMAMTLAPALAITVISRVNKTFLCSEQFFSGHRGYY